MIRRGKFTMTDAPTVARTRSWIFYSEKRCEALTPAVQEPVRNQA